MVQGTTTPAGIRRRRSAWRTLAWLCLLAAPGQWALAQVPLPRIPLPQLPLPQLPAVVGGELQTATGLVDQALAARIEARALQARQLIRNNPALIEADPDGAPMRRAELLAYAPADATLAAAANAGFEVLRRQTLGELGGELVILRAPRGLSTRRALARLRAIDTQGGFDYNHIYLASGTGVAARTLLAAAAVAPAPSTAAPDATAPPAGAAVRLGLIDGGVAASHPALAGAAVHSSGCDGHAFPTAHGTAVAALLVSSSSQVLGRSAAVELDVVDVYCGQVTGGAVDALAAAFATLTRLQVGVINISLVGPRNQGLELLVRAVQSRGVLVVAAVGNDGPAARPLYPAALPGVVAVTAVDAHRRVLAEACRGPHVQFAALGELLAADAQQGFAAVRGTSFAAPIVSGLLAAALRDTGDGAAALRQLAQSAIDLGKSGRDEVYGFGLVGTQLQFPTTAPR